MRVLSLCLISLCLYACAPQTMVTITPINTKEFQTMTRLLRPQLQNQGILDADGAWYTPMFDANSIPTQAGYTLLHSLDPSFRFPTLDKIYLPKSFAESMTDQTKAEVTNTGFVIHQGSDTLTAELIAITDWNKDKQDDWLVVFTTQSSTTTRADRVYYLLITDFSNKPYTPVTLAMKDSFDNSFKVYINKTPDFSPESTTSEAEPGQINVIDNYKITPEESDIKEEKLNK